MCMHCIKRYKNKRTVMWVPISRVFPHSASSTNFCSKCLVKGNTNNTKSTALSKSLSLPNEKTNNENKQLKQTHITHGLPYNGNVVFPRPYLQLSEFPENHSSAKCLSTFDYLLQTLCFPLQACTSLNFGQAWEF